MATVSSEAGEKKNVDCDADALTEKKCEEELYNEKSQHNGHNNNDNIKKKKKTSPQYL